MMRIALCAVAAMLLPTAGAAQEAPAPSTAPPLATPDPAKLAAAEKAVAALVPQGIYMKMMRDKMPQLMDAMMGQMMAKSPSELGIPGASGADVDKPLGESAASADPHFEERMKITSRVMFEEMGTVFDKLEPRVRAGLARAFARKFTIAQLNDFNTFFATPSGSAFASEYLLTFMDPELMQEMLAAMPELMQAMPSIMEKAEKATAHLPPPPSAKKGKKK